MIIDCDGFQFNFSDAQDVFVFDQEDKNKRNYHGLSHAMKAVDLIVELEETYIFIEVKDFHDPESYRSGDHFNHLREVLKYKYRDTWIYRWAEGKIDKPVKYLCLLELEKALISRINKEISKQLPTHNPSPRWASSIATGVGIVNFELWNERFTAWPITRIAAA